MIAGCSHSGDGPDTLVGKWGGNAIEVNATRDSVHIRTGCLVASFPEAFELSRGAFAGSGEIGEDGIRDSARVTGTVSADTIRLSFSYKLGSSWTAFTEAAVFGEPADFSDSSLC